MISLEEIENESYDPWEEIDNRLDDENNDTEE
jgi:hypothetical protein